MPNHAAPAAVVPEVQVPGDYVIAIRLSSRLTD